MKFLDLTWQFDQIEGLGEKIVELVRKGTLVLSDEVTRFENLWAGYIGSKYCVGLNSGTDALTLALKAGGIKKGDRVLVQTNTFASTVYAIVQNGGIPVFLDIDSRYGCLDRKDLEKKVKSAKPKAMIMVHLYGGAFFASQIADMARKDNILLIEDCAQAHGAKWKDKKAGTFSDISCFSFFPSKNLGATGDAGCICTDNSDYAEKVLMYRNIGSKMKNVHELEWGTNSRLDALHALVLTEKLKFLDKWNEKRRRIAQRYRTALSKLPLFIYHEHPEAYHVYHQFVVMAKNRQKVMDHLRSHNIPVLIHYPTACHKQKAFKQYAHGSLPVSEKIIEHHFSLPMSPHLTQREVDLVCEKLAEVLENEEEFKPLYR
ncbi:MAG: DegT/DnrJ/EryC1/StrS family aminotransferase [Spirochaetes bacterium]|nr:DegT/DnrJ/EryC1/StrS family aminotransferase [Spirochaetota bacterium]